MTKTRDLADLGGGFIQAGSGAVQRTVESKLQDVVSVKDFGAVGDGVADDTAAIQAAIDAVSAAGGGLVHIPNYGKYLIDSTLTVKVNVALVGPHKYVGAPGPSASAPYDTVGGTLIVNSSATISLLSNSSISGLFLYRKGIVFPITSTAAYAGTAITIDGEDVGVSHCQILGFAKAIYSDGWQRQRINNIWFDTTTGIEIADCLDVAYINQCHGWPFGTIEHVASGGSGTLLTRSGTAFYLHDTCDWARLTDCFSYGYYRGFQLINVNYVTLSGCGADNITPTKYAGSIGFNIGGGTGCCLTNCTVAAQEEAGISTSMNEGEPVTISNTSIFNCGNHGINHYSGDLILSNTSIQVCDNGVTVGLTTARVIESANRFKSITNGRGFSVPAGSTTDKIQLSSDTLFVNAPNGTRKANNNNLTLPSIASADPLNLPINGNAFIVTGTTNFGTISGGWAGRIVVLKFTDALTIFDGGGSVKLAGNFTSTADDMLTLLYDGNVWLELSRSAN
jgi:hypothetical protein